MWETNRQCKRTRSVTESPECGRFLYVSRLKPWVAGTSQVDSWEKYTKWIQIKRLYTKSTNRDYSASLRCCYRLPRA